MAQDVSCLGTDDVPSDDYWMTFYATRVVRESISISFTMFTCRCRYFVGVYLNTGTIICFQRWF